MGPDVHFREIVRQTGLSGLPDPVPINYVADMLSVHYGLSGELTPIDTEKDQTFHLAVGDQDYLVKVSSPYEDPEIVELQTAVLLHLEKNAPQLPVQRVRHSADGSANVRLADSSATYPRVLRVLEFIDGTPLSDVDASPHLYKLVGSMLAEVTLALKDFTHPRESRLVLWDLAQFPHVEPLIRHVHDDSNRHLAEYLFQEFVETVLPKTAGSGTQIVHGDLSPFNVIMDAADLNSVNGIIDFGDTVRSLPLFDLSVPMANLLGDDPDAPWDSALHIVNGYTRRRPVPNQLLELLAITAPARLLLRAMVTDWRLSRAEERRTDYLLSHAQDDWESLRAALSVPAHEVRSRIRHASSDGMKE